MTKDGKRRLLDSGVFGMMNAEETRDFNKRLHELDMQNTSMLITDPTFNEDWAAYMREYEDSSYPYLNRYEDPLWRPDAKRDSVKE